MDVFPLFLLPNCSARTSNYNVKNNGEGRHLCLVPDLRDNVLKSFKIVNDVSCGFFHKCPLLC